MCCVIPQQWECFQAGVDHRALIAIWLSNASLDTTQIYLDANLQLKEAILAKMNPPKNKPGRYRPDEPTHELFEISCNNPLFYAA